MLRTSVMDINSTSVPFSFNDCFNGIYVGMVISFVAVFLCIFPGAPANLWLLWLYLRNGWTIKPTQMFPLNLTILELIYCIQCAVDMVSKHIYVHISDTMWTVLFMVSGLSWVGRPLMQICICVEQYLAVVYPILFMRYKALQYRIVCAAVVWLIAAACAVYEALKFDFSEPVFNSVYFISVIIISFCCVSVLHALKHPRPGDTQIPIERGRERDVGNQQKRKAFNTIFTSLLIILFTYLPLVSLTFVKMENSLLICNFYPIITSFNIMSMMITPLRKMYKKGNMKCLKHQRETAVTS